MHGTGFFLTSSAMGRQCDQLCRASTRQLEMKSVRGTRREKLQRAKNAGTIAIQQWKQGNGKTASGLAPWSGSGATESLELHHKRRTNYSKPFSFRRFVTPDPLSRPMDHLDLPTPVGFSQKLRNASCTLIRTVCLEKQTVAEPVP